MKITLDATVLDTDKKEITTTARSLGHDVGVITATARERKRKDITDNLENISEILVLDESPLCVGALASDDDANIFEDVLCVVSHGAFSKKGSRDNLSKGEKHQLRDALAFASHVREGRDVFVTDDRKGFIRHGRRDILQSKYKTTIMTTREFQDLCNATN